MASISERENGQIKAANASGRTPVVFIHGLWLLPSSWDSWASCGAPISALMAASRP
jgi:pimeloyl-ACP methyl ester carboxylesterase